MNYIAMGLGFDVKVYFYRVFKKVMGISPSSYRKKEADNR